MAKLHKTNNRGNMPRDASVEDLSLLRGEQSNTVGRHWPWLERGNWAGIAEAAYNLRLSDSQVRNYWNLKLLGDLRDFESNRPLVNMNQVAAIHAANVAKMVRREASASDGAVDRRRHPFGEGGYVAGGRVVVGIRQDQLPARDIVWTDEQRRILTAAAKIERAMLNDRTPNNTERRKQTLGHVSATADPLRAGLTREQVDGSVPDEMRWSGGRQLLMQATQEQRLELAEAQAAALKVRAELNAEKWRLLVEARRLTWMSTEGARRAAARERTRDSKPATAEEIEAELEKICADHFHDKERPDWILIGDSLVPRRPAATKVATAPVVDSKAKGLPKVVDPSVSDDERIDIAIDAREARELIEIEAASEGYGGWEGSDQNEAARYPEARAARECSDGPAVQYSVPCPGRHHRGRCSYVCEQATRRTCTCVCGGSNHGTVQRPPAAYKPLSGRQPQAEKAKGKAWPRVARPALLPELGRAPRSAKTTQARRVA
jgi:hypothetical protein